MTRQAVLLFTLFAFVMTLSPVLAGGPFPPGPGPLPPVKLPVQQQQWNQQPWGQQQQWGQNNQYNQGFSKPGLFGSTGKKIANIALTAAGTIVAGLFGSQFGMVGTVIGGAAGLLVSRWIANKIFPSEPLFSGFNYGQQYYMGGGPKWSQTKPKKGGLFGFGGNDRHEDHLKNLQRDFVRTYNEFKGAISSGDQASQLRTKDSYDRAREAYYSAKNSQFR